MKKALITRIIGQDGSPRKLFDSQKITHLNFNFKTTLKNDLKKLTKPKYKLNAKI